MTDPGDVGQGADFGADLYQLLRTGWVDFPALSLHYWHLTQNTAQARLWIESNAGKLGPAGSTLVSKTYELVGDLQQSLADTTTSLRDTGTALVTIANDYAATDEAAQAEFDNLRLEDMSDFAVPPISVPDPPEPSERGTS